MKIALLNQPLGNRGDESAHKAFIRTLIQKFPQAKIDVIFLNQKNELIEAMKVVNKNIRYVNIRGLKVSVRAEQFGLVFHCISIISFIHPVLKKFRKLLKEYDHVICAPGGICMGGFMNWDHIYQLLLAKSLGKSLIYWGRSIGPFSNEDFRHALFMKYSTQILHYATFISLRDAKSLQIASHMGLPVISTVDSAFLEVPSATLPDNLIKSLKNTPYVVYVPNSLTWHYRYNNVEQQKIDQFYYEVFDLIYSLHPDCKIVMLPQTYSTEIADFEYFKHLSLTYTTKNKSLCDIIVVDENQSSDIQQQIISKAELVIGARYHSIVFAINNNRPFVSLSYEHKMSGLLDTLDLTQYMVEIQNIFDHGNEVLFDKAIESIKEKIKIAKNTPEKTTLAKQISYTAFEEMCAEIEKHRLSDKSYNK